MEGGVILTDAERGRVLTTSGGGMHCEGCVAGRCCHVLLLLLQLLMAPYLEIQRAVHLMT